MSRKKVQYVGYVSAKRLKKKKCHVLRDRQKIFFCLFTGAIFKCYPFQVKIGFRVRIREIIEAVISSME